MLLELHARDLGVIDDLHLVLGPGMTAFTGETGAGKTLLVEAIELLVGGRADSTIVRSRAGEALVEGRFEVDGEEIVVARAVPVSGRSRAYIGGRLATVAELAELGQRLVDLHGQHAHQSLLKPARQREALDAFGGVDLGPLRRARAAQQQVEQALADLGGDARTRAREIDLLKFQVAELEAAAIEDPDEDRHLEAEEERLADATAHRSAGATAYQALAGDRGASDGLGIATASVGGRQPFLELETRLRAAAADLDDITADLRRVVETISEDPARLEEVRGRRRLLRDLSRKYGDELSDILAFEAEARDRLRVLEDHDDRVRVLEEERVAAADQAQTRAGEVARARREAAPALGTAVETHLRTLAMPSASFQVSVEGEPPADDVSFLLAANPGEPALPLSKVASGGELARVMLAARLVLTDAPPVLVFDEVDAGVGGQAAVAVGRALSALSSRHQVLVVTHLPQVAAFADHQVAVTKQETSGRAVASAQSVQGADRVVELSRMLSGQATSTTARDHAEELLAAASRERAR